MGLRLRLFALLDHIRGSYWFLPALMSLAAIIAAIGLVWLDGTVGDAWLGEIDWLAGSRPEGARAVLSAIAGSTITVAGVVFSITLAAVTYASGQYGPRLITNFQRDRRNQFTLGVFVATYLYCLTVLRTIRSAAETSADTGGLVREAFVPHIAVYGALALAVASIGVLIFFVHHVTGSIHVNSAIARIGRQLIAGIRDLPAESDHLEGEPPGMDGAVPLAARATGYVEAVDHDALLALAARHALVVRVDCQPGDFVRRGQPLFAAAPAERVDAAVHDGCAAALAVGAVRTPAQDLRFALDELVEIAARALSPGVNDPFTAVACVDWLGASLGELDGRVDPPRVLRDEAGAVRLLRPVRCFEDHLRDTFAALRPYAKDDAKVRGHARAMLGGLAASARLPERRAMLEAERERWNAV